MITDVRRRGLSRTGSLLLGFLSLTAFPALASAEEKPQLPAIIDALVGGKPTLDMRIRWDIADFALLERSNAVTLRTRLGYGTKSYYGFSAYGDFENIVAVDDDTYFNGVETPTGESLIAEPEETEVNQAYVLFKPGEIDGIPDLGIGVKYGRQRIKLDDDRFIGNVGWRQNEQTYDALRAYASFGIPDFLASYMYIHHVQRIFGDDGPQRDWDSDSHAIHLDYSGFDHLKIVGFAYLLDFNNAVANSSDTYGLRLTGSFPLGEDFTTKYAFSYAYQMDAADNPNDYEANYVAAELGLGYKPLGTIGAGYELLGSDDGVAQFLTPLATLAKFQGFADVFLAGPFANGGPNGLQEIYAFLAPKLPFGMKGKLTYHYYEADEGNNTLGHEFGAVVSRKFYKHITLLGRLAYFEQAGNDAAGLQDRYRVFLQATFKF